MLHEVDRQWCRSDGTMINSVVLVRYADDMVLLARTEPEARQAGAPPKPVCGSTIGGEPGKESPYYGG